MTPEIQAALGGATRCNRCGGPMGAGMAIAQTYTVGLPDFPGQTDLNGQTVSPGGEGTLVDVLKCRECGHSFTALEEKP